MLAWHVCVKTGGTCGLHTVQAYILTLDSWESTDRCPVSFFPKNTVGEGVWVRSVSGYLLQVYTQCHHCPALGSYMIKRKGKGIHPTAVSAILLVHSNTCLLCWDICSGFL